MSAVKSERATASKRTSTSEQASAFEYAQEPEQTPVLEVRDVTKTFDTPDAHIVACNHVSLSINQGQSLALVGESGSGKSTLARMITGLLAPDSGSIKILDQQVVGAKRAQLREIYRHVQMVFQNPVESFNPRRTLGASIIDAAANVGVSKAEARSRVPELLSEVGLPAEYALRYPSQVSGGECQRAAIARAMMFDPELIICDEATSALDVLVQAQIIDLINDLRKRRGMSLLFICHDLAVARAVSDDVAVMLGGRIVECGKSLQIIGHASHPYTQLMEASVFPTTPDADWKIPTIAEQNQNSGCPFYSRCAEGDVRCARECPALKQIGQQDEHHFVACWKR